MEKQVEVKFENYFSHRFFDYVPLNRAQEIIERIGTGKSQIVFFLENGIERFAAVLDFHSDRIHVSEVGGSFPAMWRYLKEFTDGLAKALNVKIITFVSYVKAVEHLAKKAGFTLNEFGEFERRLS